MLPRSTLRIAALTFLTALLVSACSTGIQAPRNGPAELAFLTGSALVLTHDGDQGQLQAVALRADGSTHPATVTYTPDDPTIATITPDGTVTAHTDLGSTLVTVTSGDLPPLLATVVVAQLTDAAVFLQPDDILSSGADQTTVVLSRNDRTETITPGDVLISDNLPAHDPVLATVESVDLTPTEVRISGTRANLNAAFTDLSVRLETPTENLTVLGDQDGFEIHDQNGTLVQQGVISKDSLECDSSINIANLTLAGFSFDADLDSLGSTIDIRIENEVLTHFEVVFEHQLTVEVSLGKLELKGGLKGTFECKLKLPAIPLGKVPVAGPVLAGGKLQPTVGIAFEVEYAGATVELKGPRIDTGVQTKLGIVLDLEQGAERFDTVTPIGQGVTWGAGDASLANELTAKIEPFFSVSAGLSADLGLQALASFEVIGAKLFAGAEITAPFPLNKQDLDYTGPRWKLYAGFSASLQPLADNFEFVTDFLEFFGAGDLLAGLIGIDLTLAKSTFPFAEAPEPVIEAEMTLAEDPVRIELFANGGPEAEPGSGVTFLASEEVVEGVFGPPQPVASATLGSDGSATAEWFPGNPVGTGFYVITAHFDSVFGEDLPYAPLQKIELDLRGRITAEPDSVSVALDPDESTTETVTLISDELRANYTVTAAPDHVVILAGDGGTVEENGSAEIVLELTCPDTSGTFEGDLELAFTNSAGEPIAERVPSAIPIVLECLEGGVTVLPSPVLLEGAPGEVVSGEFTLFNAGTTLNYTATFELPGLVSFAGGASASGQLPQQGSVDVSVVGSCPQETGVHSEQITFAFEKPDGTAPSVIVPAGVTVRLICRHDAIVRLESQFYGVGVNLQTVSREDVAVVLDSESVDSDEEAGTSVRTIVEGNTTGDPPQVTRIEGPAIGFGSLTLSRSAAGTLDFPNDVVRSASGAVTLESLSEVEDGGVIFSGSYTATYTEEGPDFGTGTDRVGGSFEIIFQLPRTARLEGSWSCLGFNTIAMTRTDPLSSIFFVDTAQPDYGEVCEISTELQPGRYVFRADGQLGNRMLVDPGLFGGTRSGAFNLHIFTSP